MSAPTPTTSALRCSHSLLLETAVTIEQRSRVWVASIRPAPHLADDWHRDVWPMSNPGWTIPTSCVFGTVIEFGADIVAGPRKHRRTFRWYGIALAHEPDWLVVHGPFPLPTDAHKQADAWLTSARAYAVSLHAPSDPTERPTMRPRLDER